MFKTITARYAGTCKRCGRAFEAGTRIRYGGFGRTYHLKAECVQEDSPAREDAYIDEAYDGAYYREE